MALLSRSEEVYMVAVWELKDNAYGVTIKDQVSRKTGKIISYGGLYFALDKLVKKGLLTKTAGEPTAKRGGRTKFYYSLTDDGKEALRATFEHQKSLWAGVTDFAFE
ncbi:MAG: PadR family transcriptional regulator [bacterium]